VRKADSVRKRWRALLRHSWPGNVRELRNSIERAKLLARDGTVRAEDLNLVARKRRPAGRGQGQRRVHPRGTRGRLRKAAGNITRAAQILGISRQALYRRMERLGIRP